MAVSVTVEEIIRIIASRRRKGRRGVKRRMAFMSTEAQV